VGRRLILDAGNTIIFISRWCAMREALEWIR
jgi:hypothetical protein